jgi:F-type H+-transporting ATPase subunit gamma
MANARAITKRRKAVRNIRKITQTMQLIATARYQKCMRRAMASKPYTQKITEMIATLAGRDGEIDHPLLQANEGVKKSMLLVLTANRGMCGGYNASVLRGAMTFIRQQKAAGVDTSLEVVGKKGVAYLKFLGQAADRTILDVEDQIEYLRVAEMADRYMAAYEAGEIASVDVAYTQFVSVGSQVSTVARLLPIEPPDTAGDEPRGGAAPAFEFLPEPELLLKRLIPETVKIRLYQYFNEAIVSEQVARMVEMKAATDAAGDMIKFLTRRYNRARQGQITLELADIVGGAAAVE